MLQPEAPANASAIRFRVRYAETDGMAVVHHSRYLPWLEMGRTEFIRERGYTYREMEQLGVLLAVIAVEIRYRAPAVYDDRILLQTELGEFGRVKVRFRYRVHHEDSGRLLAEAETTHAFLGRNGQPLRVASQFPEIWERLHSAVSPAPTE